MANLKFVFLILALVCFLLAAIWVPPNPPRVNLIGAGLFFATLAWLVAA